MKRIRNRVTELLGVEIPIVQAPMGWIARAQLASAVSNAGGMGIIETSSGELDAVREEIRKMRDLTDKPFGVNIAQLFVRDPKIVDFVVAQGVRFVTTSAGDPTKYTAQLKSAGLTVFHVVPTLRAALKAVEAGAVHANFKQAICDAAETDTVFLNRQHRPGLRALRTRRSERLERDERVELSELGRVLELYFGGDMEASIALSGQVAGRIEAVRPVAEILRETLSEFRAVAGRLGALALA